MHLSKFWLKNPKVTIQKLISYLAMLNELNENKEWINLSN